MDAILVTLKRDHRWRTPGCSFVMLVDAMDGPGHVLDSLAYEALLGVRLIEGVFVPRSLEIEHGGETRPYMLCDYLITGATGCVISPSSILFAEPLDDGVALLPHPHLETLINESDLPNNYSAEDVVSYLRKRQKGELDVC